MKYCILLQCFVIFNVVLIDEFESVGGQETHEIGAPVAVNYYRHKVKKMKGKGRQPHIILHKTYNSYPSYSYPQYIHKTYVKDEKHGIDYGHVGDHSKVQLSKAHYGAEQKTSHKSSGKNCICHCLPDPEKYSGSKGNGKEADKNYEKPAGYEENKHKNDQDYKEPGHKQPEKPVYKISHSNYDKKGPESYHGYKKEPEQSYTPGKPIYKDIGYESNHGDYDKKEPESYHGYKNEPETYYTPGKPIYKEIGYENEVDCNHQCNHGYKKYNYEEPSKKYFPPSTQIYKETCYENCYDQEKTGSSSDHIASNLGAHEIRYQRSFGFYDDDSVTAADESGVHYYSPYYISEEGLTRKCRAIDADEYPIDYLVEGVDYDYWNTFWEGTDESVPVRVMRSVDNSDAQFCPGLTVSADGTSFIIPPVVEWSEKDSRVARSAAQDDNGNDH